MSEPVNAEFVCRIDARNTIVAAGERWNYLLHRSSLDEFTPPPFLGKRLWSHLGDTTAMHLYEALVAKVRRTGKELSAPCRLNLTGRRLHLEMRVLPQPAGGIEFRALTLREEPQPATTFSGPRRFSAEFLRICGWCKRIAAPEWVEVDVAIRRLQLLEADEIRRVTHSICPECAERVIKETQG